MESPPERRLTLLLDRLALLLAVLAITLRWAAGRSAGTGVDLFIHALFWIAAGLWAAGRGLAGGGLLRVTGAWSPAAAFSILCLASCLRASYALAALAHAVAVLSFALLLPLTSGVLGARRLLLLLVPTSLALAAYALLQYLYYFPQLPAAPDVELARRIAAREVSATFVGPNQFAGFLAFAIPILAGVLLDAGRPRVRVFMAGGLAGCALALAWTGSLGGGVALGAGAAAFAALAATRSRGRKAVVLAGAAAAAAGFALLLGPLLPKLAEKSHSLHVRSVYWKAAFAIAGEAPLRGVGLDNFEEHFYRVKSEVQQESGYAHNDYLQILAETGAPGLLAFLALLALGLRPALVRERAPAPEPPEPEFLVAGAAAAAFVLALLLGLLPDLLALLVCLGAWLAGYLALRREEAPGPWTRIGTAAGLTALLVHLTVDFDFYEPGLAMTLFLGIALAAALRGGGREIRGGRGAFWGAAAALLAVALPLFALAALRALPADGEIEEAERALGELGREGSPTALISDAQRLAEAARRHNPLEPDGPRLLARAKFQEWHLRRRPLPADESAFLELQRLEGEILEALQEVILLRRHHSPAWEEKARAHWGFHRFYRDLGSKRPDRKGLAELQARPHLEQALRHQREAFRLYPTYARNAYQLARILDASGRTDEALPHYRRALGLSELAGREMENLDRLKLNAAQRARAFWRLDRRFDARDVLESAIRHARVSRAELEDEDDELMGPVIRDAQRTILR
jgi:tetratricopeptide (TPR) repeat protein